MLAAYTLLLFVQHTQEMEDLYGIVKRRLFE